MPECIIKIFFVTLFLTACGLMLYTAYVHLSVPAWQEAERAFQFFEALKGSR